MEWAKHYYRGWHIYWNKRDNRMYAKENSLLGKTYHFPRRYPEYLAAMAVAEDWVRSRR